MLSLIKIAFTSQASVQALEKDQICRGTGDKYSFLALVAQNRRKSPRQVTTSKPRPSDDPFGKLMSFNKLNGGGGGGGGATFVFRVSLFVDFKVKALTVYKVFSGERKALQNI